VAKDTPDIIELARDSDRIGKEDGSLLKDDGGGGDADVTDAAGSAGSWETGSGVAGTCTGGDEGSSWTAGLGVSFTGVAKGSSVSITAFWCASCKL
jgi:hypothetical protein